MEHAKQADSRSSQVDRCYQELRRLIVSCEIPPGARLTEKELIDRLGYGRTPVREALLRLDQDRLIDTKPRSGYRVRKLTRKSVTDFFAVWRTVAPLIAELAVARLAPEDCAALSRLGEEREQMDDDDLAGMSRVGSEFFNILVEAADNEPLAYIYRHLGAEMERVFQLFFQFPEGKQWMGGGKEIAAFQYVTDPQKAANLLKTRVMKSEEQFLELLDQLPDRDARFEHVE